MHGPTALRDQLPYINTFMRYAWFSRGLLHHMTSKFDLSSMERSLRLQLFYVFLFLSYEPVRDRLTWRMDRNAIPVMQPMQIRIKYSTLTWRVKDNIVTTRILEHSSQWIQVVPLGAEQAAVEPLTFRCRLWQQASKHSLTWPISLRIRPQSCMLTTEMRPTVYCAGIA